MSLIFGCSSIQPNYLHKKSFFFSYLWNDRCRKKLISDSLKAIDLYRRSISDPQTFGFKKCGGSFEVLFRIRQPSVQRDENEIKKWNQNGMMTVPAMCIHISLHSKKDSFAFKSERKKQKDIKVLIRFGNGNGIGSL